MEFHAALNFYWGMARLQVVQCAHSQKRKLSAGIMISSAVVESLFSKYGYTRSKARSSMKDNTAAAILSTHELDDLIGNVEKPFSSTFSLRGAALSDRIDWV